MEVDSSSVSSMTDGSTTPDFVRDSPSPCDSPQPQASALNAPTTYSGLLQHTAITGGFDLETSFVGHGNDGEDGRTTENDDVLSAISIASDRWARRGSSSVLFGIPGHEDFEEMMRHLQL
jgi:hypothetical protein